MSDIKSYGYYASMSVCVTNSLLPKCKYVANDVMYSFSNAFTPMRNKQDSVSVRLQNELTRLATNDENTQYILAGVCIGLVLLSAIFVMPIFMKVIRDKSHAFSIFSHITTQEIHRIINECKKLEVKKVRFRREWLTQFAEQPAQFWRKIRTGSQDLDKNEADSSQHLDKVSEASVEMERLAKIRTDLLSETEYDITHTLIYGVVTAYAIDPSSGSSCPSSCFSPTGLSRST